MILLDANILIRMSNRDDPDYLRTLKAVFMLRQSDTLVIAPQTLYEFWAVATRSPANNGLGMSSEQAGRRMAHFGRFFQLVHEPAELLETWSQLVQRHDVKGFRAHDVRYAALMQLLKLDKLMTYNIRHFQGLPISIVDPGSF